MKIELRLTAHDLCLTENPTVGADDPAARTQAPPTANAGWMAHDIGNILRRAGPMCPAFRGGVIGTVLLVADGLGFGCRGLLQNAVFSPNRKS